MAHVNNFCSGCQIEIWSDAGSRGQHFTCPANENGNWCYNQLFAWFPQTSFFSDSIYDSFGYVGNDNASTITCTCPVEFESIEYDIPREDWNLDLDFSSGKFSY